MGWLPGRLRFGILLRSSDWPPLVALAFVLLFLVSPFGAEPQAQGLAEGDFKYFYKNPDLEGIPKFLSLIDATGAVGGGKADNRPPIIGFLTALFQQNPGRVESWISGQYSRHLQGVIAVALVRAGMTDRSAAYLQKHGWPAEAIEKAAHMPPSLLMTRIRSADDLDILWGASFATGSKDYPTKIIDFVARTVESGKYRLEDIMYFAPPPQNLAELKKDPVLKAIVRRYGREGTIDLLLNGVAVWGLGSNAVQHEFVMELIKERVAKAPNSDLSYLLCRSAFRQTYPKSAMLKGKGLVGIFSQSSVRGVPNAAGSFLLKNLGNSERAVVSAFESFTKNEFGTSEPVVVWGVLMTPPDTALDIAIQITSPSGAHFVLDTIHREAVADQHWLVGIDVPIEPSLLREEGGYTVNSVVRGGTPGNLDFENHFFVGRRQ